MGKQKHKTGTFVRLALADGSFGYGRLLEPPHVAFYDHRTTAPDSDLDGIASKPVLFKIAVNLLALNAWEPIGWRALEEHLTQPLVQFRQDVETSVAAPSSIPLVTREPPSPRSAWGSSEPRSGSKILSRNVCSMPSWGGPMKPWST
ncbi:Imm26 family immunity protein [Cystobacter fuscus]